jgi:chemotaxis protein methyltransferase CheR
MTAAQTKLRLTDGDLRVISDIVHCNSGIVLNDGKRELVLARISKQVRASGCESVTEFLHQLMADSAGTKLVKLIDALSTNVTSFFREPDHFAFISDQVLPKLRQPVLRSADRRLRLWSAGCSSGEEAYSLAITLAEALKAAATSCFTSSCIQRASGWDVKILATDISSRMLDAAREGNYSGQSMEHMPVALLSRYFIMRSKTSGLIYDVRPQLRDLVRFRHLNLIGPWPFRGPLDVIMCRNVMIYFDKPTQENLVHRFWNCLKPGGLLFTGHSESLTAISHRFHCLEPSIYERT